LKRLAGLAAAAFFVAGPSGAAAPVSNLQITLYSSAQSAEQVRACLLKTLTADARRKKAPPPTEEPFTHSPANASWTITFRHADGPASIVVNAQPSGSQVLYPNQVARAAPALAQAIEDCG